MISDYEWKTNGWQLVRGGGLRREQKSTVVTNDLRITTVEVYGTNGLESCQSRKYQTYQFGELLTERVWGVGANKLTNSLEYHTNLSLSTTGLLKQVVETDGRWVIHQYETNRYRTNTLSSFLNQSPPSNAALVRSTEYFSQSNAAPAAGDLGKRYPTMPRLTVESVQGHEVSRTYKLYYPFEKREVRCLNPGALWSDSNNLVTLYKWYDSGANTNKLKSIEYPDGRMEIYDYGFYTETNPVAVMHGTNICIVRILFPKVSPMVLKQPSLTEPNASQWSDVSGKRSVTRISISPPGSLITSSFIATTTSTTGPGK
jgi:hypothetical protein